MATETSEYAGKKAGDKIVELLKKNKTTTPSVQIEPNLSEQLSSSEPEVLTAQEINDRGHLISSLRFYVTDSSGNPIDLNGIDWYIELIVKSTKI